MRGAPVGVGPWEETGWGMLVSEGKGAEGGGIGGEVRRLVPVGEWKRCIVVKLGEAEQKVGGEWAKAAEVVYGEREEVKSIVIEVVDVRNGELCMDTIVVSSNCGHRIRLIGDRACKKAKVANIIIVGEKPG